MIFSFHARPYPGLLHRENENCSWSMAKTCDGIGWKVMPSNLHCPWLFLFLGEKVRMRADLAFSRRDWNYLSPNAHYLFE